MPIPTVSVPATIRRADLIFEPRFRRTLIRLVLEDENHGIVSPTFPPDRLAGLSRAAGADLGEDEVYALSRLTGRQVNAIYLNGVMIQAVASVDGTVTIPVA